MVPTFRIFRRRWRKKRSIRFYFIIGLGKEVRGTSVTHVLITDGHNDKPAARSPF